jgi:hypothetical protein
MTRSELLPARNPKTSKPQNRKPRHGGVFWLFNPVASARQACYNKIVCRSHWSIHLDSNLKEKKMSNSCLLWPVLAPVRLVGFLLKMVGRLVLIVVGFLVMIAGVIVSFTVIGACIGIPMILLGVFLVIRGLF